MKVTIMGSGTMVPSNDRNSSGVLIEHDGIHSMLDFGYGTLHHLLKVGLTYHDIDRIYFTHNHPDHMCDLVPFFSRHGIMPTQGRRIWKLLRLLDSKNISIP